MDLLELVEVDCHEGVCLFPRGQVGLQRGVGLLELLLTIFLSLLSIFVRNVEGPQPFGGGLFHKGAYTREFLDR